MRRILITGGAGFIGSHLSDHLLKHGYEVRALDVLHPQVHGPDGLRPDYLHPDVDLVVGDVTNPAAVAYALDGVDAVVHLAARVGVGQSMYEPASYARVNDVGTAVLLEQLEDTAVRRLVVASSMSVYGEGLYLDAEGERHGHVRRSLDRLRGHEWEPRDERGRPLEPVATPESKQVDLASVYALTKYAQERMCLMFGEAYERHTVALRLFNVYGPRQALSNPYTGVLAIFASRLLQGRAPLVFEDGRQKRDFVHVHDVARAFRLALERDEATGQVVNVGSGNAYTIAGIARRLASVMGVDVDPTITGEYRVGDIRHCFADPSRAESLLGFRAEVDFDEGMGELAEWLGGQEAEDRVEDAKGELARRGLAI